MDEKTTKKNRLMLLLLLGVFLAPALGSWLLYANIERLHLGTTNHGEFVEPAVALDGSPLPAGYLQHRWTLVYLGGSSCDPACRDALATLRATQLALGEQMQQVQRLYLADAAEPDDLKQDKGLTFVDLPGSATLRGQFGPPADAGKYIYLVDTRGNLMMRYPLSGDRKWILQDLRHLLGSSEG
jgi:cytochrome oxidase Cu insertion factor (SCO1/SenC/PrrC family)